MLHEIIMIFSCKNLITALIAKPMSVDKPKSVRLSWNNQKVSFMNSPVISGRNEKTPVASRINSIILQ